MPIVGSLGAHRIDIVLGDLEIALRFVGFAEIGIDGYTLNVRDAPVAIAKSQHQIEVAADVLRKTLEILQRCSDQSLPRQRRFGKSDDGLVELEDFRGQRSQLIEA